MFGKWKVTSQYLGDQKMFAVYRLRDTTAVDHSGNREFGSGYLASKQEAEDIAEQMNMKQEAEHA